MACTCGPGQVCQPLKPGCWGYQAPSHPTTTNVACSDCGVEMQKSNDGSARCPYCNSWAFRDAVSDGAIYSAASQTTTTDAVRCYVCGGAIGCYRWHSSQGQAHPWCADPDAWHPPHQSLPAMLPRGCVCPPGSEKTCMGVGCPRKAWSAVGAI